MKSGQLEGGEQMPPDFSSPRKELQARESAKWALSAALRAADDDQMAAKPSVAVWGTGAAASGYLNINPTVKPDFFVESEPNKLTFRGTPVIPPNCLPMPGKTFIIICSDAHEEISRTLEQYGYTYGKNFAVSEQHPNRLHLYCSRSQAPIVLDWMQHNLAYFESRGRPLDLFGRSPRPPEWNRVTQADVDILIYPTDIPTTLSCPHLSLEPNEVLFDIQWSPPLGLPGELPMYSWDLRSRLFTSRQIMSDGLMGQDNLGRRLLYAYHMVLHKAEQSGLPLSGTAKSPSNNSYVQEGLRHFPRQLLSLEALAQFLTDNGCFPPAAEVHAWAEALGSPFLQSCLEPRVAESQPATVFFLRGQVSERQRDALRRSARSCDMHLEHFAPLSSADQAWVFRAARGGVWNETPASLSAGLPTETAICRPQTSRSLRDSLVLARAVKQQARQNLEGSPFEASQINWLHSTDSARETEEVLARLGRNRGAGSTIASQIP